MGVQKVALQKRRSEGCQKGIGKAIGILSFSEVIIDQTGIATDKV